MFGEILGIAEDEEVSGTGQAIPDPLDVMGTSHLLGAGGG